MAAPRYGGATLRHRVLCLAVGAVFLTAACAWAPDVGGFMADRAAIALPFALAIALPFALIGVHALLSGLSGTRPTRGLVTNPLLGLILLAGIVGLAVMAAWRSIAWRRPPCSSWVRLSRAISWPLHHRPRAGRRLSFDTTRWTETVSPLQCCSRRPRSRSVSPRSAVAS